MQPEDYCSQMRNKGVWGGGPEILALVNSLRRPIHVFEPVPACNGTQVVAPLPPPAATPPALLAFAPSAPPPASAAARARAAPRARARAPPPRLARRPVSRIGAHAAVRRLRLAQV